MIAGSLKMMAGRTIPNNITTNAPKSHMRLGFAGIIAANALMSWSRISVAAHHTAMPSTQ